MTTADPAHRGALWRVGAAVAHAVGVALAAALLLLAFLLVLAPAGLVLRLAQLGDRRRSSYWRDVAPPSRTSYLDPF